MSENLKAAIRSVAQEDDDEGDGDLWFVYFEFVIDTYDLPGVIEADVPALFEKAKVEAEEAFGKKINVDEWDKMFGDTMFAYAYFEEKVDLFGMALDIVDHAIMPGEDIVKLPSGVKMENFKANQFMDDPYIDYAQWPV